MAYNRNLFDGLLRELKAENLVTSARMAMQGKELLEMLKEGNVNIEGFAKIGAKLIEIGNRLPI